MPPTDEALKENIKRAHFTASLWKICASGSLPPMSPCDYGWEKIENVLIPVILPSNTQFAPDEVLNTTHCRCIKQKGSKSNKCSCVSIETSVILNYVLVLIVKIHRNFLGK